jgi:hypothetical protein
VNEPDTRLAALDPAASEPYRHPDLESMINRITSRPAKAHLGWRDFRLKVAAAAATSALVTVGAIAALEGGVASPPLLAVQGTASGPLSFNAAQAAPAAVAPTAARFVAGPRLSHAASTGVALEIRSTAPRATAIRLATDFGILPSSTRHQGADWLVRGRSGASLDYQQASVPQWYYSSSSPKVAPATESDVATGVPRHAALEATVTRYLTRLGFTYYVSAPRFADTTVSGTSGTTATTPDEETITGTVTLDGAVTDQTVTFTVNRHDAVLYATGPDVTVRARYAYPLRSPVDGVAALNTARHATSSRTTVTLVGVTTSWRAFRLGGGATWLLPVYGYRVTTGRHPPVVASVLAVDPTYFRIAHSASGLSSDGALEP